METESPKIYISHVFGRRLDEGDAIEAWPAHMTLVKPVRLASATSPGVAVEAVGEIARLHRPLLLTPIGRETFGPPEDETKQATAIKIRRTEGLHRLHLDLVHALEKLGTVFTDTRWMLDTYNPHSTVVGDFDMAEPVVCDNLTISLKSFGREVVTRVVDLG